MVIPIQPRDHQGWYMLPQAPEDAGYYVYGNVNHIPGTGALAQYAHPNMLSVIFWVEREWEAVDDRKFGIGNISLAGGLKYEHAGHIEGNRDGHSACAERSHDRPGCALLVQR